MKGEKSLPCPGLVSAEVPLVEMAPDVCLSHLAIRSDVVTKGELASGGFGTVWKGEMDGEDVAIKQLHIDQTADAKASHLSVCIH